MRVRTLELRLLAGLLCALWASFGIVVAAGYHPGGPFDALVSLSALLPAAVAAAAIRWPPVMNDGRMATAVGWLGVVSALVIVPSAAGVVVNIAVGGRQILLPSAELAYAGFVALLTTCLFVGLGLGKAVRERPRSTATGERLALGAGLGLVLTLFAAVPFGAAALANDHALRSSGTSSSPSRFGPTDLSVVPPACSRGPRRSAAAHLTASATASLDREPVGTATLEGDRRGEDTTWHLQATTEWSMTRVDFERTAAGARIRRNGGAWESVGPVAAPDGAVLDEALDGDALSASEDFGFELVGGARARHCRIALDGPSALDSFPMLRVLAGGDVLESRRVLAEWRGTLDYWVFADGQVGVANATISGLPGGIWPRSGLRAVLEVRLEVTDRDFPPGASPS